MNNGPVPPGGAKETGKADGRALVDDDWRAILRRRADALWQGHPVDGAAPAKLSKPLGPLADDALKIVEAYSLGARTAIGSAEPPPEFGTRLDLILNGIEAS